jgi:hypothetical protein
VAGNPAGRPIALRLQRATKLTIRAVNFAYLVWVILAPTAESAFFSRVGEH